MSQLRDEVIDLWPEIEWITDTELKEKVYQTWELAFERSVLVPGDLKNIPFTLLVADLDVSFIAHKRSVVHIARDAGLKIKEFYGSELPVDMDVLIAGAILADVGKLLEYELVDGKAVQGKYGKYLRHPFSGVSLAEQCGIPADICHIIASHAGEGSLVKRTTEAYIVHHADFMTFSPFKERLQ